MIERVIVRFSMVLAWFTASREEVLLSVIGLATRNVTKKVSAGCRGWICLLRMLDEMVEWRRDHG